MRSQLIQIKEWLTEGKIITPTIALQMFNCTDLRGQIYKLRKQGLNIKTIKNRLKKRGDKKEEAARRIEADLADFKGLEDKVDHIVYNNDRNTIPEVVDKIISYLEEAHKTEG